MLRMIGALLIGAALTLSSGRPVAAAAEDYVFEAETTEFTSGNDAIIGVRLLNKATGNPVANAVIFQTRLDMSPENMADMTGKVTSLSSEDPRIYRFRAELGMAGRWALKLAAKVPGEAETVRGGVEVTAAKSPVGSPR